MPWPLIVLLAAGAWLLLIGVFLAIVDACRTIRRGLELDWLWDDQPVTYLVEPPKPNVVRLRRVK